jgi:ribonuclease HI
MYRCFLHQPTTLVTSTAPAVGHKISLRPLGLSTPPHMKLYSSDICLGSMTNNQAKYTAVIGLLADAQHHSIRHLSIFLDSQLVVLQLNNVYRICDPFLFHKYLQVRLLSQHFDSITFTHIPRQLNQITDNLANIVLD